MIIASVESLAEILIVLILATEAIIIMKRDILSLITTYAFQSMLLAVMARCFLLKQAASLFFSLPRLFW